MTAPVYLDYNATTPLLDEARVAMLARMDKVGNPSSVHSSGRAARQDLETARRQVAALVDAAPAEVVFTSGGTEANGLALNGVKAASRLVSSIEHDAVLAQAPDAALIPVDGNGVVDLDAFSEQLCSAAAPALVSIMWANNETGVIQPVCEIAGICRDAGAIFHTDAVQAAGKLSVNFRDAGADMMTLSAHKIGGPAGVGALIIRSGLQVTARQTGGGQEKGYRSGTENLVGICGFGAAAEVARQRLGQQDHIKRIRDRIETGLMAISPASVVNSAGVERLDNTLSISMPGVLAETQVMVLDLDGVMVSAGSACSSGKVKASHVLTAMKAPDNVPSESIRISLGPLTTDKDADRLIAAWAKLFERSAHK